MQSYAPVIFVSDDEQKLLAEAGKRELEDSKRFPRVAVQIKPAFRFWPAEIEHQDYYKKNPYATATIAPDAAATRALARFGAENITN